MSWDLIRVRVSSDPKNLDWSIFLCLAGVHQEALPSTQGMDYTEHWGRFGRMKDMKSPAHCPAHACGRLWSPIYQKRSGVLGRLNEVSRSSHLQGGLNSNQLVLRYTPKENDQSPMK